MATKDKQDKAEEAKIPERGYTTGAWAGKMQYACRACAFDSLDLDVILEHLVRVHAIFDLQEPAPLEATPAAPSEEEGEQKADGIFEIDLKEDQ